MLDEEDRRSVLRILDANLNRLAEALRVVEDVCRFHWNQSGFGAAFKRMRHGVFAALEEAGLERSALCRERDIEGDVGRDVDSPALSQLTPEGLALRNLERAKEALRVVQECCRTCLPAAEASFQEIRYQLYAEEKGLSNLVARATRGRRLGDAKLYLLAVPGLSSAPVEEVVAAALHGGVDVVQLRAKSLSDCEVLSLARGLREVTARAGVLFIMNDRPDLARLAQADGVHLGQHDLPIREVRSIVGGEALIGLSTHSRAQARAAELQGVDYIGVGPVFATTTKENPEPVMGPREAAEILRAAPVPAFAIGGINAANLAELVAAGCDRVAVAAAISTAADPRRAARNLRSILDASSRNAG